MLSGAAVGDGIGGGVPKPFREVRETVGRSDGLFGRGARPHCDHQGVNELGGLGAEDVGTDETSGAAVADRLGEPQRKRLQAARRHQVRVLTRFNDMGDAPSRRCILGEPDRTDLRLSANPAAWCRLHADGLEVEPLSARCRPVQTSGRSAVTARHRHNHGWLVDEHDSKTLAGARQALDSGLEVAA